MIEVNIDRTYTLEEAKAAVDAFQSRINYIQSMPDEDDEGAEHWSRMEERFLESMKTTYLQEIHRVRDEVVDDEFTDVQELDNWLDQYSENDNGDEE